MKNSRKPSLQWEIKSPATPRLPSALKSTSLLIKSLPHLSHSTSCVSKWAQIFKNSTSSTPTNRQTLRIRSPNQPVSALPPTLSMRRASNLSLSQAKSLKPPIKRRARKARKIPPKRIKLGKILRKMNFILNIKYYIVITLSHSSHSSTTWML